MVFLLLLPDSLSSMGAYFIGSALSPMGGSVLFLFHLLKQAADITVESTFSTSYAAIVRDIAVGFYVVFRIYRRGGGLKAVVRHVDNIQDATVAIVAAFVITFLYHSLLTVPQMIRTESDSVIVPPLRMPVIPKASLARSVYRKRATITASSKAPPQVANDLRAKLKITKITFSKSPICAPESAMSKKALEAERKEFYGPPAAPGPMAEAQLKNMRQLEANSFFVNVYYQNVGTLPALSRVHGRNICQGVPSSTPNPEGCKISWDNAYNEARYPLIVNKSVEFQVGDTACFSVGRADSVDKVEAGEEGLWIYAVIKYTDASMKPEELGITEIAAYFINTLDSYAPAINRIFVGSTKDYRTGTGETKSVK